MSKLDEKTKLSILESYRLGRPSRFIAAEHGIGKSTVGDFLRKETYQDWWAKRDSPLLNEQEVAKHRKRACVLGSGRHPGIDTLKLQRILEMKSPNQAKGTIWDGPNAPTMANHKHGPGQAAHRIRQATKTRCEVKPVPKDAMARLAQSLALMSKVMYKDNPKLTVQLPGEFTDDIFKIETLKHAIKDDCTHFVIPDTQVKPGVCMKYLDHVGAYMADKQPEVIVMIGDHADMPSLSSYDKGTKKAEGKTMQLDFDAAIEGMKRLLRPIYELQQRELRIYGRIKYKPVMVLTIGNHEERIMRHVNYNPELAGFVSYDNLKYKEFGWDVIDFLVPKNIHGVNYVHYMANPMTGRPYGGQALNILKQVGESFVMGHKQCLDIATRFLPASGKQQWAIIAGACYSHDEDYKGPQGNKHWRGVVILNNVKDGTFNPKFVDLDYMKKRFDAAAAEKIILDNVGIW